jgi:DNA-binding response OmpR family regulator
LILTAKTESEDLVAAMQAGADDYVTKPLKSQELRIRLAAACRILDLEERLALALGQSASAARTGRKLSPGMSGSN